MSTTPQALITQTLHKITQIEPGATPTPDELNEALVVLNDLLESWRNESLMCYTMRDLAVPLLPGQGTRTVGPSPADVITDRPLEMDTAYVLIGLISYPVQMVTADEFSLIVQKTLQSAWPLKAYYAPTYPAGTITFWPVTATAATFHANVRTPVSSFATLADVVDLPPGWNRALVNNLAVALSPYYQEEPSATTLNDAKDSLKLIKRTNNITPTMQYDASIQGPNRWLNGIQPFMYGP